MGYTELCGMGIDSRKWLTCRKGKMTFLCVALCSFSLIRLFHYHIAYLWKPQMRETGALKA